MSFMFIVPRILTYVSGKREIYLERERVSGIPILWTVKFEPQKRDPFDYDEFMVEEFPTIVTYWKEKDEEMRARSNSRE
jgi:DNA mismatch repair protein MutH